ncbi:MAG: flagellar basal body-associated FliL family protein [Polymorphobacter sp.]|uniref:flagellar basal body-associated FliL family protein n=1 Tax=Polymorphobacter sp. TaxID=1909290 RepID=UPI003A863E05
MPDAVMDEAAKAGAKPVKAKKAGGLGKTLLLVLGFVLAAGAAGLGAAVGVVKFGGALIGEVAGGAAGGAGHAPAPAPVGPVEYAAIESAFTSNLVDTGRYLQVKISVATTAGKPVVEAMKTHEPAVVSAVLAVLGEAGEADVGSRAAKTALSNRVRDAINMVLRERGVTGEVSEVLFTSLVVQ